jgi:hypothetical protein
MRFLCLERSLEAAWIRIFSLFRSDSQACQPSPLAQRGYGGEVVSLAWTHDQGCHEAFGCPEDEYVGRLCEFQSRHALFKYIHRMLLTRRISCSVSEHVETIDL